MIAPETAAHAAGTSALLPMLALGIPGSPTAAVLLGGLLIWGLQPGPLLFVEQKDFVWGLIASMYLGNLAGLIIVLTCVPLFAAILRVPFSIIAPVIIVICAIGAYTVHNAMLDIWFMMMFGVVGYVFKKLDYPLAPLVLALVLGDRAEDSFRQSMLISQGDMSIFFSNALVGSITGARARDAVLAAALACRQACSRPVARVRQRRFRVCSVKRSHRPRKRGLDRSRRAIRSAKKGEVMKRSAGWTLAIFAAAIVAFAMPGASIAQQKKLVLWTHWDQNPEFNKWYADKGKEFAKKTGYEVEVVTIPYQGYEAKYLAAFMAKNSAPDMFMGMTHQWCGQYDFCDKMPADLEKIYDQNLPKYMADVGKWKGVRYGIPIEHGNFQQMYINVDMFKKAGLNPDDPPKTFTPTGSRR